MDFERLSTNSEKLLLDLIRSDNPVQLICTRLKEVSQQEYNEIRGILRELREKGYINLQWASNVPYYLTLNNSAMTYIKKLDEQNQNNSSNKMKSIIFISHRSTDKAIADMLLDFFIGTGISRESIFCSSLPGNDINEKISSEIKDALKRSLVNIAILSKDYYQSAYCLNEAGILWYRDGVPVIPIALPEIDSGNMYGFLNNEYKLRRLDIDTDISSIYDTVRKEFPSLHIKFETITYEISKLKKRYITFLETRETHKDESISVLPNKDLNITTDDERIVLYYIIKNSVRRVSKDTVKSWLQADEIYEVNIDNAFDLLASVGGSSINNDTLELGIDLFRRYSVNKEYLMNNLQSYVDQHRELASDKFMELWGNDSLDSITKLFICYIVDERVESFGCRWKLGQQVEKIEQWEEKNHLNSALSSNYENALQFLIINNLVYESDWTSYGNPREYALCPSLKELLFDCPKKIRWKLDNNKMKKSQFAPLLNIETDDHK